jgi:hypothetical protein
MQKNLGGLRRIFAIFKEAAKPSRGLFEAPVNLNTRL